MLLRTIIFLLIDASAFNGHFVDSLPFTSCSPDILHQFLSSSFAPDASFSFHPVSLNDLYRVLKHINLSSAGPFDFNGRMLLLCLLYALDPLLHILNTCISSGVFPLAWKNSTVISLPKTSEPASLSSFRPISLPLFLSKLLEHLCFNQLSECIFVILNRHSRSSIWFPRWIQYNYFPACYN